MNFDPVVPLLEPLLRVRLRVAPPRQLGQTPLGTRRFVRILGGEFQGEGLEGQVLEGGGDWLLQRGDDSFQLDARYTLQTAGGELIYVQDSGLRHGAAETMQRLANGEAVDPAHYYFRTSARLETGSATYDWLNGLIVVGSGARGADGVVVDFFAVR
ncbi:DUF3237 domain-containing protein [Gilvimarinus sp. F26214L]|uniref:DUF3237 domain-containing protein n=1 Tax=Gilvimarinus sp. DZF01 TaxID=3461371 RepID=UPI004045AD37